MTWRPHCVHQPDNPSDVWDGGTRHYCVVDLQSGCESAFHGDLVGDSVLQHDVDGAQVVAVALQATGKIGAMDDEIKLQRDGASFELVPAVGKAVGTAEVMRAAAVAMMVEEGITVLRVS